MRSVVLLVGIASTRFATADPIAVDDLSTIRSQVGWGASLSPDRVALTSEAGWNGADRRASANVVIEAALLPRLSVLAGAEYGDLDPRTRPSLGVAYQVLDPRKALIGLRLSLTYKPEGFTEPGGEIESVAVLSRPIGEDVLRAMIAYGRDPEGHDSDAELGTSYVHRAATNAVVGWTARYRRALVAMPVEAQWDALAGAVGGYRFGRARFELMLGGEALAFGGVNVGPVGIVSVGADL